MNTETNNGPTPTAPGDGDGTFEPAWAANWGAQLYRSEAGSPLLPVEFVAAQGNSVRLIDVRAPQHIIGLLGYIPGSDCIPNSRLESLPERIGVDSPLIIVSRHGGRESEVARILE